MGDVARTVNDETDDGALYLNQRNIVRQLKESNSPRSRCLNGNGVEETLNGDGGNARPL